MQDASCSSIIPLIHPRSAKRDFNNSNKNKAAKAAKAAKAEEQVETRKRSNKGDSKEPENRKEQHVD